MSMSDMIRVVTKASKSLRALDRSFELDMQLMAVHAQALLARRVHDEVLAALPAHDQNIAMAEARLHAFALGGIGSCFYPLSLILVVGKSQLCPDVRCNRVWLGRGFGVGFLMRFLIVVSIFVRAQLFTSRPPRIWRMPYGPDRGMSGVRVVLVLV